MALDALEFHLRRGAIIMSWLGAFAESMILPEFRSNGWAVEMGDSDGAFHSNKVVVLISQNAFLNKGKKAKIIS